MSASQPVSNRRPSTPPWVFWALGGVTLLAALLRLWQLDQLPPGLFFDEAYNGVDARAVADGQTLPLYFTGNNGREPLYLYLQAVLVRFLGPTAYSLRLTSALIGIVTIPLVYFGARTLLLPQPQRYGLPVWAAWPSLVGAAGLAVSFWHVSLSRLAFRAVLLPPLTLLAVAYFWRAWSRGQRRDYLWSGFWFGLSLYSYVAARLLPFAIIAFVLLELIIDAAARREGLGARWGARLRGLAWLTGAGVLVLLPLLTVFAQDPALIAARTGDVSIFTASQTDMPGTPTERLVTNTAAVARSFYDQGDLNIRHNLPTRPVHDWLLAVLFTLGWLAALWRIRMAHMRLLLLWFGVMALPSLLSTDAPHALRMVGMLPPLALLYAVGTQQVQGWAARRDQAMLAGGVLFTLVLLVGGMTTARDYFDRWATEPELGQAFDLDQQLAAQTFADALSAPEQGTLTTRRLYLTPQTRFALGPALSLDPASVSPADLALLIEEDADLFQPLYLLESREGRVAAAWVNAGNTDHLMGDLRLADDASAVTWPGQHPEWPELRSGKSATDLALRPAAPRYPLDVTFENGLQLLGYDLLPEQVTADDATPSVRLATYWQRPAGELPPIDSFDLFAHLLLADGAQVQENGNLGRGFPLALWPVDALVDDRRTFALPPDAASGKARFELGLYDPAVPAGAARLAVVDAAGKPVDDRVLLGAVAIDMMPPRAPVEDLTALDVKFDERIALVGWSFQPAVDDPTTLAVELAWESLDRVSSDYTAFVHLLDPSGTIVAQFDQPPGGVENSTTNWLPGERVRTIFPLAGGLPLVDGYGLRIGLYEPVSGRQLLVSGADAKPGETFVLLPLEAQP
jgi:hypothetical protein